MMPMIRQIDIDVSSVLRRTVCDLFSNLGLAVAGNLAGGLLLVTFARSAQALASPSS